MAESLSGTTQEALVALLLYDEKAGAIIRGLLPVETFDRHFRPIVQEASAFWQRHKKPPGDHALDIFENAIQERPKDKEIYERLFQSIEETKAGLNSEYILGRATAFARQQRLRVGIMRAVDFLQDDKLDDAEKSLTESMRGVADLFDPGTRLGDYQRSLAFLSTTKDQAFPTGIREFDRRGLGPTRKELHLFIAPAKRGKSWWLVHLGKQALLNRLTVVHVSLEMSEARVCQRYMQALFAVSKRDERVKRAALEVDKLGRVSGIEIKTQPRRPSLEDANIDRRLRKMVKRRLRNRAPLYVKEFPTRQVGVREVVAYLDALESSEGVVPDLLIVDYPKLFRFDSQYFRLELGQSLEDLRGVAVERNIAVAVVHQGTRDSIKKALVQESDAGEDISVVQTADTVITYNQTFAEKSIHTARLYMAVARNDEDKFSVIISQSYPTGQFCLASARMSPQYDDLVKAVAGEVEEDGGNP